MLKVTARPRLGYRSRVEHPLERAFFALTPERILAAVEVGGRRATGYALSLVTGAALLWVLGQFDDVASPHAIAMAVVLAVPGSVGAAAARRIV